MKEIKKEELEDDCLEKLIFLREKIYSNSFDFYDKVVSKIENFPFSNIEDKPLHHIEKRPNKDTIAECKEEIKNLKNTDKYFNIYLKALEEIVKINSDYSSFNEKQRKIVKFTYDLAKNINRFFSLKMIDKNGYIDREYVLKSLNLMILTSAAGLYFVVDYKHQ